MRIALIGHTCSPSRGSEPGIGWNWAWHLSRHHEVVFVAHPLYKDEVDAVLASTPRPGLTIHWLTTNHPLDRWKPKENERGLRLHYSIYQKRVLSILRELHAVKPFDLIHHASWGTLQQPPLVWKMGLPFVWGPLGGGQTWPASFLEYASPRKWTERVRTAIVNLTPYNPSVRRAAQHADVVLAVNPETAAIIRRLGARRVEAFADSGTHPEWLRPALSTSPAGELKMLFAGRCEGRKGLPLILQAMALTPDPRITLKVAGEGPLRETWREQASELGLSDRVQFLGSVSWEYMDTLFKESDVLVFPSLRDSGGTVVLEAMSRGLPLITLDHQGVSQLVTRAAAIKIPVTRPQQTIQDLADAMTRLAADPALRLKMGEGAVQCATANNWDDRAVKATRLYEEIVDAHRRL